MAKFYGQRTCTMDFTTFTQDYQQITHTIIAEMLHEENLLHEIDTIQISIHATDTYLFASKHENYCYFCMGFCIT